MENSCYYHISLKINKNVFLSSLHISLNVVISAIIFLDKSKLHSKNSSIFYFSVLTSIFQSFTVYFWFVLCSMRDFLLLIWILEADFESFGWLASCFSRNFNSKMFWNFKSLIFPLQRWFSPPITWFFFNSVSLSLKKLRLRRSACMNPNLNPTNVPIHNCAQDSDLAHFLEDGNTFSNPLRLPDPPTSRPDWADSILFLILTNWDFRP